MSTGQIPPPGVATNNGEVLLGIYTAAGANLDCLVRNQGGASGALFQGDFDHYIVEFLNIVPSVDNAQFAFQYSADGGLTWLSAVNSYFYGVFWFNTSTSGRYSDAAYGTTYGVIADTIDNNVASANILGVSGKLDLWGPSVSASHKYHSEVTYYANAGSMIHEEAAGQTASGAYNALRLLVPGGTVTSGIALVYGKAKSASVGSVVIPAQRIVNVANVMVGGNATGSTILPLDATIPQITEGDQYMSLAYTPASAANKLKIDVVFFGKNVSSGQWVSVALFQDAVANALTAFAATSGTAGGSCNSTFSHFMTAGTTSPITFRVRAGLNTAGTLNFNGGGNLFGGMVASSITVTEIAV